MSKFPISLTAVAVLALCASPQANARPDKHSDHSNHNKHNNQSGQGKTTHQGSGHGQGSAHGDSQPTKPRGKGSFSRFHRNKNRGKAYYASYRQKYGHKFKGGWFYKGRRHHHWGWSYYSDSYRTTFYYDPATEAYYYWCAARDGFYPTDYIDEAPPTSDLGPLDGGD